MEKIQPKYGILHYDASGLVAEWLNEPSVGATVTANVPVSTSCYASQGARCVVLAFYFHFEYLLDDKSDDENKNAISKVGVPCMPPKYKALG